MGTMILGPAVQSERGSPQGAVLWALRPLQTAVHGSLGTWRLSCSGHVFHVRLQCCRYWLYLQLQCHGPKIQ